MGLWAWGAPHPAQCKHCASKIAGLRVHTEASGKMETGDAPVVVEAVAEAVPAEAVAAVVEAGAPGSLHDALAMFKGTPGFEMASVGSNRGFRPKV